MSEMRTVSEKLAAALKTARKKQFPKDSQAKFAHRIGVSRETYNKMEKGDLRVAIESYLKAATLLTGERPPIDALFTIPESLFGDRPDAPR